MDDFQLAFRVSRQRGKRVHPVQRIILGIVLLANILFQVEVLVEKFEEVALSFGVEIFHGL
jgi:hypothetical protein